MEEWNCHKFVENYIGITLKIAISFFCIFRLILFLTNDFKACRSISVIKPVLLIPILKSTCFVENKLNWFVEAVIKSRI